MPRQPKIKVTWDDALAMKASDDGATEGLLLAARMILGATNQVVPYAQGTLMGSGAVDFYIKDKIASVYYDTVYARKLHQNPRFKFQNGRRGKYLQYTLGQSRKQDDVLNLFGEGMKAGFRRRSGPRK